ncbi:MAG: hypothetical protein IPO32_10445 [Crocinitomicaceae bacterium]|nr:hypothetical protein [Crocinitomicaceae bacterium]
MNILLLMLTYLLRTLHGCKELTRMSFQNVYNMGLNVGYLFPNNNQLEIGWNQDATGSMFTMHGWSDQINTNSTDYYVARISLISLVLCQRFNFQLLSTL